MSNWFIIEGPVPPAGPVVKIGTPTEDNKVGLSTTQTLPHDGTGSAVGKRGMKVVIASTDMVASVTYGGLSLTLAREDGFGVSGSSIWTGLNVLPTGINNVIVTYDSAISSAYVQVQDYDNVNQVTPIGDTAGSAASVSSVSNSITIAQDSEAVDICTNDFYLLTNTGPAEQITIFVNQGSGDMNGGASFNSDQNAGLKAFLWDGGFASPMAHSVAELKVG